MKDLGHSEKNKEGDNFRFAYRELLKDTGRMTAEQCIQKHLGRDIRDASFWQEAMGIINDSITSFEALVDPQGFEKTLRLTRIY